MQIETHPAVPNVQREAAAALENVRRACHYLEDALSAARCSGQISMGGESELLEILRNTNNIRADLLIWRHKNGGPRLRSVQGNGGGATVGESSATPSPLTDSPAANPRERDERT